MLEALKNIFRKKMESPAEVSTAFSLSPAEEYNTTRAPELRKSFCYAPSVNMLFAQDGSVQACCHNADFTLGKYPQQSISEIWNNAKAKQFRTHMEQFELPHGCGLCKADLEKRSFNEIRAAHFDHVPQHPQYPTMMEFLLTNICNLECVMCFGKFSSLIRKNRDKLPAIKSPYDDAFIEQLREFIPHLYETRFSGSGEAFSIDMNYSIWDMIIELNPKCIIMVQTNGTFLNARIRDYLSKGNFQIGVSLDSMKKEVYEGIRVNSSFEKVMENIRYFHEYSAAKKMKFNISTCVMRNNWRELPDFVNFANSMNAVATFHKVWSPEEYAIHNLPVEELNEIYAYLSAFDFPAETFYQKQNREHYFYTVSIIKDWIVVSSPRDKEIRYVSELSNDDLMAYFKNKLHQYLLEVMKDETERINAVEFCVNKLESILGNLEEKVKNDMLKKACLQTAPKMYSKLTLQDVKDMSDKVENYVATKYS